MWLGGLDWHGAVALGLAGLFLMARLRGLDGRALLDALAFALPLGATLTFGGCLLARCAYGREVASLADYPALLAAELPDLYGMSVPRLLSQGYGIALGLVLLLVTWGLVAPNQAGRCCVLAGAGAAGTGRVRHWRDTGRQPADGRPATSRPDSRPRHRCLELFAAALIAGIRRRPEPVNLIAATPSGEL